MPDQDKILGKVRKLLALAGDTPYPAEAETALATARRLMLEHGLEMADVEHCAADREFREETVAEAQAGAPLSAETSFVWTIVERFFFCHALLLVDCDRQSFVIIGRREHLPMGRHVGIYLSRTFRALWRAYSSERRAERRDERMYYAGLALGIELRLFAEREKIAGSSPRVDALIRAHDRDLAAEVHRRHPKLFSRESRLHGSDESFLDGFERGQKIEIRRPLAAPGQQKRLI